MRWIRLISVLVLAGFAGACTTRNMLPDAAGTKAMLAGNDPMSYHAGKPVPGTTAITTEWDGGQYRFASEASRTEFLKAPQKYAPQYGGYCSNGAPYSIMLGGSATTYKIVGGRLFMFSDPTSRKYWEMDEAKNVQLGDQYWSSEMKDAWSASVHSYRRILFKVPHYKSGKELEAEWQARQKK